MVLFCVGERNFSPVGYPLLTKIWSASGVIRLITHCATLRQISPRYNAVLKDTTIAAQKHSHGTRGYSIVMKNIKFPIIFATLYLFVYSLGPFIGLPEKLIITMFLFLPIVTVWMVIRILKDGEDTHMEFDEGHLYEDMPQFEKPH